MNVIISGLTAAGKTTHSHLLAGQFGLRYMSASQVLLSILGMFPVQARDFWLTEEAQASIERAEPSVDNELVNLEAKSDRTVFDTVSLPWLCKQDALSIWLESSFSSRTKKAIVSHHGEGRFTGKELESLIFRKDEQMRRRLQERYGWDLYSDRTPFDMIVDISECISEPTFESAIQSIDQVQRVLYPAVGWYLTHKNEFRMQFKDARRKTPSVEIVRCPDDLCTEGVV